MITKTRSSSGSSRNLSSTLSKYSVEARENDAKKLQKFLDEYSYPSCNRKTAKVARKWMQYDFPLHKAVKLQDEEMIRILLEFGANITCRNSKGKTPAEKAFTLKHMNWEQKERILEMLTYGSATSSYTAGIHSKSTSTVFSTFINW